MTTSIVAVTHNRLDLLQRCIKSIRRNTNDYELILIANAPDEETRKWIEENRPDKVTINDENIGYPAAVNQGANAAEGRYLCFMNDDVMVPEGWLVDMIKHLESDPRVGAVGPLLNNVSGPQYDFPRKGAVPMFNIRLCGVCILTRLQTFFEVGGLDTQFWSSYDDDDFCLRLHLAGYKNLIIRDLLVYHVGGATYAKLRNDYEMMTSADRKKFFEKWKDVIEPTKGGYQVKP